MLGPVLDITLLCSIELTQNLLNFMICQNYFTDADV